MSNVINMNNSPMPELAIGDIITIRCVICGINNNTIFASPVEKSPSEKKVLLKINIDDIATVIKRNFKVNDVVRLYENGVDRYKILAIDKEFVWIKDSNNGRYTVRLNQLYAGE